MDLLAHWHFVPPIVFFLGSFFHSVSSFNIEERTPIIKIGPKGSLFGLSVAQHHISQDSFMPENAVLLVGAPTDDRASQHSIDVKKPGGLYRCSISMEKECTRVIITPRASSEQRSNSSDQWLGVSVKSQRPGGKIVVCAHRYTTRGGAARRWEAVIGRCFMLGNDVRPVTDSLSFDYTPCLGKTDPDGQYSQIYYGYCQAGTSVAFAEVPSETGTEEYLVFGAPGSFVWTGAVYTTEVDPAVLAIGKEAWSQEEPEETGAVGKNDLLGSSVTSGPLFGNTLCYVSGAPGANVTGAVAVMQKLKAGSEEKLEVIEMVFGDRVASRFGNEVALVDVSGDGLLDLIVGAPQYYDRENKLGGAVYIFVNKGTKRIGPLATQKLFGPVDSMFGMSITSIGDINMDGVDDLAVGAPGADFGKGAVYIYHGDGRGNSAGVHKNPTQILRAADLMSSGYSTRNLTGMGYSISGGLDMDFNGYPDVAVGSLSDSMLLFQARPIVNMVATIDVPEKEIIISGDTTKNKLEYDISICLKYTSLMDQFDEKVMATSTLKLDADRLSRDLIPRASFSSDQTNTIKSINMTLHRQSRNETKCKALKTFISDEVQDKLSPIKLELTFSTIDVMPERTRRQIQLPALTAVMNASVQNHIIKEIHFAKDCGMDDICESKLSIAAYYQVLREDVWTDLRVGRDKIPVLKLGSEKQIGMVINVSNSFGEDAHQAGIRVRLPRTLHLRGSDILEGSGFELHCNNVDNETSVFCTLGNPFKANQTLKFRLKFSKQPSIHQATNFVVQLQLQTTSKQPGHDRSIPYPVVVQVEAQLMVDGYPSKEQIKFGGVVVGESAVKKATDAGTVLSHYYEVTNSGTGPAENVVLHITWPQSIKNGKWLFYLLEAHVQDGKGNCTLPEAVNPLGLDLAQTRQKRYSEDADETIHPVLKESSRPESSLMALDCDSLYCIEFDCFLGTISTTDSTIFIGVTAVLWNSTFLEEYGGYSQIHIQSYAKVTIAQDNVEFSEKSRLNFRVSTDVLSEVPIPPSPGVKWWIIMVAGFAGVILLVCLVLLLWKCGFFKRQNFGDYQKARRQKQASQKAEEKQILH